VAVCRGLTPRDVAPRQENALPPGSKNMANYQ
jgi:hypothetical protein